jgi:hypothetical protein
MQLTPEECIHLLHRSGWSVGEVKAGDTWQVTGVNGENRIRAEAATSVEAWNSACQQAEALVMLRRRK